MFHVHCLIPMLHNSFTGGQNKLYVLLLVGMPGHKGESGPPGTTGLSGTPGTKGDPGFPGTPGVQGNISSTLTVSQA